MISWGWYIEELLTFFAGCSGSRLLSQLFGRLWQEDHFNLGVRDQLGHSETLSQKQTKKHQLLKICLPMFYLILYNGDTLYNPLKI